jgi:hypothetical protein
MNYISRYKAKEYTEIITDKMSGTQKIRGAQIFQKYRSHFKILGAINVT